MSGYPGEHLKGVLDRGAKLLQKPFSGETIASRVRATLDETGHAKSEAGEA